MIWKQGHVNELDSQIWFHNASLSFSGVQQLIYEEGGAAEVSVNSVAFAFKPIQGDVDNNGAVNILDLSTVATFYDEANATYDLNGNGIVDIYDLVLIGANFGYKYP
jgi:hypothetical protein